MGWNSWNTFGEHINETMIKETADSMVENGLLECGYEYLVIDDCWSLRERDKNGRLVADPEKFPHGMKAVAEYVHQKGLKFGMYSCAGNLTCAGYPGSFEHEFIDAATFAEWGVDFLNMITAITAILFRENTCTVAWVLHLKTVEEIFYFLHAPGVQTKHINGLKLLLPLCGALPVIFLIHGNLLKI